MLSFYKSLLLVTLIFSVTFLGTTQAQYLNKSKYPAQSILNNTNVFENNFISSISKSKNIIHNSESINAIFSEDFDGIPGPTAGGPGTYLFPSGWVLANVDGFTPAGAVSYVNEAWERREDFAYNIADSAAFSTSWYSPVGQADDWMITPAINIGSATTLKWNAVAYDPSYPDGYEVRISTTTQDVAGCLANPVLLSVPAENSTWTERTVDLALSGYVNQTVYIAFRNHSIDMFLLLIDDILVEEIQSYDAELTSVLQPSEYTMIPAWQNYPLELGGSVRNNGSSDITNVVLTAKVYQNSTLVHTEVGAPVASISAGSTMPISLNSYAPGDTGIVSIDYLVTINEIEQDSSNNSGSISAPYFSENEFARDDNIAVGSLGIGAGNGGELGQSYFMNTSGYIRGVKLYFTRSYANEPVFANIRNIENGLPTDLIAVTDTFYAPDDSARWISLNISGGEAALAADTFLVSVNEVDSTLALGNTTNIFTTGTLWANWPTSPFGGWANLEAFGAFFAKSFMLRPLIYETTIPVSSEVLVMIAPAEYKLSQNYPNPFNPVTRINFQLPNDSHVTLKIYDVVGSEVATLVNEIKVAGNYNFDFNASSLASGVYYYKLQAGDFVQHKKMILLK